MSEYSHDESHDRGHHVLEADVLIKTILVLVALTILTVGLALLERAGWIPLGGLSVPVALAIAGTKATFVAMNFMGLRHDGGTNALAFVSGIVFLLIFLSFTWLDTGFRDVFEVGADLPIDLQEAEAAELEERLDALSRQTGVPPLVVAPDTVLLPNAPTTP